MEKETTRITEQEQEIQEKLRAYFENRHNEDCAAFPDAHTHPIMRLAEAFRDFPTAGGIATAAAIAFAGAHLNVFSRRLETSRPRAARAFVVVLGESGSGKSTIMDMIRTVRSGIGERCGVMVNDVKPKSDAALLDALIESGTKDGTGEDGKTIRIALDESESPRNTTVMIDEAGSFLESVRKNEKCGNLSSALCDAFSDHVGITHTRSTRALYQGLPSRIQANTSMLLAATIDQWIKFAANENENDGMIRRRLIFMEPEKTFRLLGHVRLFEAEFFDGNEQRLFEYAERLARIPQKQVFTMTSAAREQMTCVCDVLTRDGIPDTAQLGLALNYATILAAIRCALSNCTEYTITRADMLALTDILAQSVCRTRQAIQDRIEADRMAVHKSKDAIWREIMDWIGDGKNWANTLRKFRSPGYAKVLREMNASGDLVKVRASDGKNYVVRVATDEERDAVEQAREQAQESVFDGYRQ